MDTLDETAAFKQPCFSLVKRLPEELVWCWVASMVATVVTVVNKLGHVINQNRFNLSVLPRMKLKNKIADMWIDWPSIGIACKINLFIWNIIFRIKVLNWTELIKYSLAISGGHFLAFSLAPSRKRHTAPIVESDCDNWPITFLLT